MLPVHTSDGIGIAVYHCGTDCFFTLLGLFTVLELLYIPTRTSPCISGPWVLTLLGHTFLPVHTYKLPCLVL